MRKRTFLIFGLVLLATVIHAQRREAWTQPHEPFRIADNLYYVGTADLTSFLITTQEGHILIDAPLDENVEKVLASIRELGFEPADIMLLLASHGHLDHTGGMARMLEATGAELVLSREAAALVGRGGRGDFHLGDRGAYPPAKATRLVGHLETVSLGPVVLTAHLTPGHTKGCTSWSGEVTIGGRTKTWVSICSLTVLSGYRLAGDDPSYPGIARDFCSSVAHLRTLKADLFLASHGSFFRLDDKFDALEAGDEEAFVDPSGYRDFIARAAAAIDSTLRSQGEERGCNRVLAGP